MKHVFVVFAFIFSVQFLFAQESIEVYPTTWWVGMKNKKLQLVLHSKDIQVMEGALRLPIVQAQKLSVQKNWKVLITS